VIFLVDGISGVTPADIEVAGILRKAQKMVAGVPYPPILVVVNKADSNRQREGVHEFYELGLGDPYPISAVHGTGTGDLLDDLLKVLPEEAEEVGDDSVKIAIVGKPNVGKSSLLNRLAGEDRSIVSDIPGTTRDAVDTYIEFEGITAQDAHIAGYVKDEWKSTVVIVNKWDAIEKDTYSMQQYTDRIRQELNFMDYVPLLFISAMTGQRVDLVLPLALRVQEERLARITTGALNRILQNAQEQHSPTSRTGTNIKLYYGTQVRTDPPTFMIYCNNPQLAHFTYLRFLENQIRKEYPYTGTPIRIVLKPRHD
jgi:GTP-binding protein